MSRRPKPSITVVGAGRVGRSLARALAERGFPITDVVARTAGAARDAVAFVGAGRPVALRSLRTLGADIVLVTVSDDAIGAVAARLAGLGPSRGAVALHASGALGSDELAPLAEAGLAVGSMHPLRSFPVADPTLVQGCTFAIEGDRMAVAAATRIARAVGAEPVRIRAGSKTLYHAAAVLASGGVTSLLDMSLGALERAGFSREAALRALMPLVAGTVENVARRGTAAALTGPFARGDERTIAANRDALATLDPRVAEIYDLLGERARELAAKARTR